MKKHKTAKQVRLWMRSQPWYRVWKGFVLGTNRSFFDKVKVLMGFDLDMTLFFFYWSETLQGASYWKERADEFTRWYYGE